LPLPSGFPTSKSDNTHHFSSLAWAKACKRKQKASLSFLHCSLQEFHRPDTKLAELGKEEPRMGEGLGR